MPDNAYRQDLVSVYREGWLITMSIITMRSVSRKLCVRLFTLCKISTAILRILGRHLQTDLRNVYCLAKYKFWSRNKLRKHCPNRCIIGDAILPQTDTKLTKKAVLNLALYCGAICCHREKPEYRCTTTIHPVYKCWKKCLENLLPVGLFVRTILFIPSRFWTTSTKFDTCCLRYIAMCGKKIYTGAHPHFRPKLLRWNFL